MVTTFTEVKESCNFCIYMFVFELVLLSLSCQNVIDSSLFITNTFFRRDDKILQIQNQTKRI